MCNPCLYTADPRIWALHKRMDCGCSDLTTFNKVMTDMSLFFIYFRWTTSSWAPLTLLCCVWPQAPLKVLQWTQALLCRSTLLKCPADLCSQIFIRWNQLMDSLCPKHASGLYVHLLPTGVWLQILLSALQHLMATACRYTVIIEEKLLMKLLIFFGYGQIEGGV